jgi:hypothetical protein
MIDCVVHRGAIRRLRGAALLVVAAALVLPASAAALPKVSFKVLPVPIPGFRHTGYILGAGAALQAEYKISGSEYGGFPPPLIGVNLYFPTGTKLHPAGFPTCPKESLERVGPSACPKGSAAGPVGRAVGVVAFGGERVEEATTIESFYAPGGGIEFFTVGHSPAALEILSSGHYLKLNGAGGFGLEFVGEIPLVSTVPGAAYAVVQSIKIEAGSARMVHGKPVYYGTVPSKCPSGGSFPVKTEMIFDEGGANPPVPETVTVGFKAPCPRK